MSGGIMRRASISSEHPVHDLAVLLDKPSALSTLMSPGSVSKRARLRL